MTVTICRHNWSIKLCLSGLALRYDIGTTDNVSLSRRNSAWDGACYR